MRGTEGIPRCDEMPSLSTVSAEQTRTSLIIICANMCVGRRKPTGSGTQEQPGPR